MTASTGKKEGFMFSLLTHYRGNSFGTSLLPQCSDDDIEINHKH